MATEAEPSASEPGKLHRLARAHWDRQKKAIGSEPIDDALIALSLIHISMSATTNLLARASCGTW